MAEIFEKKTRKTHFFNTGPYGDPPEKWDFFKKNFFAFVNFENIHKR